MYILAWTILAMVHASLLYFQYEVSLSTSLIDALVSNAVLSLLALNFWFSVRFMKFESQKVYMFILNHVIIAAIYILLSSFLIHTLLSLILPANPLYFQLLWNSVPWRISMGLFYYMNIVLIYYLYIYYHSFKSRLMNEAELYRSVKDTELLLLKSQLHPHFIFNSLNSINALIISEPERAQEMVVKLSQVFRRSLDQSDRKLVSLQEELEYGLLYLDIEKIRFEERLNITVSVEEKIKTLSVPHMLLQPLFENCIKHGLQNSPEGIHIFIRAEQKEEYLHLSISNEFDEGITENKKGTGLSNIKKRLALIYGRKDLIQVKRGNKMFEVELMIPTHSS